MQVICIKTGLEKSLLPLYFEVNHHHHTFLESPNHQLSLVEIDKLKSDTLLLKLQKQYPTLTLENNISRPEEIDIVINASPSGMNKNDLLPIDPYTFRSGIMIADSITKPNFTPFLKSAKSNGCFIQKGNEMADAQLQIFLDFLGTPPENSHV